MAFCTEADGQVELFTFACMAPPSFSALGRMAPLSSSALGQTAPPTFKALKRMASPSFQAFGGGVARRGGCTVSHDAERVRGQEEGAKRASKSGGDGEDDAL